MLSRGRVLWPLVLAASLALHGVVGWRWGGTTGRPPSPLGDEPSKLLLVPFETVEAPRPPTTPVPRSTLEPRPRPHPAPRTAVEETSGAPRASPSEPGAADGAAALTGLAADAPRVQPTPLTPRSGVVLGLGSRDLDEPARGATLRNGPGEVVDETIRREVEGEVLTRRLNAELLTEVGAAAVEVGSVPQHFRRAEASLRELLGTSAVDRTPWTAKELVADVATTLSGGAISDTAVRKVTASPLGEAVQRHTVSVPTTDDNRFREQGLQLLAGTEALKERARRARLKTVLQLTTDPTGAVADVTVVERSGDARFDESVLHLSRRVFRRLPDDDEKALGADWWQTRWAFTYEPPQVRVRLLDAHRLPPAP